MNIYGILIIVFIMDEGLYIVLSKEKINRINTLARLSKTRELTESEKKEQAMLREEYLKNFRKSFRKQLDSIEIVD